MKKTEGDIKIKGNCLVILNYNDSLTVTKLLNRIKNYNSLDHILIVDNFSNDDSYNVLRQYEGNRVSIIRTEKNQGYAAGNNYGAIYAIRQWQPKTLFFANPDVLFEEKVITAIENALYKKSYYAVATVLVEKGYNAWDLPKFWGTIRMLFMLAFTSHKACIKRHIMNAERICEVGVVEGSFFAIKTAIFEEINGFDERTFLYLEENILAHKLKQRGYREIVLSNVRYVHEHSASIKKVYHSKAKAFKLFYPSFKIFLRYYVQCNNMELGFFVIMYAVAYVERVLYDISVGVIRRFKKYREGSEINE